MNEHLKSLCIVLAVIAGLCLLSALAVADKQMAAACMVVMAICSAILADGFIEDVGEDEP